MAWHCSGETNKEMVSNLKGTFIFVSKEYIREE